METRTGDPPSSQQVLSSPVGRSASQEHQHPSTLFREPLFGTCCVLSPEGGEGAVAWVVKGLAKAAGVLQAPPTPGPPSLSQPLIGQSTGATSSDWIPCSGLQESSPAPGQLGPLPGLPGSSCLRGRSPGTPPPRGTQGPPRVVTKWAGLGGPQTLGG